MQDYLFSSYTVAVAVAVVVLHWVDPSSCLSGSLALLTQLPHLRLQWQVRTLVQQEMQGALSKYDALLSPTAPTPAYRLGEKTSDPLEMYKGDLMTVNLNLSGLPAIVVPCGLAGSSGGSSPLPVGLQFVGRAFQEGDLCAIAHVFERTASALVDATPAVWAGRGQ